MNLHSSRPSRDSVSVVLTGLELQANWVFVLAAVTPHARLCARLGDDTLVTDTEHRQPTGHRSPRC
jgi:hypothetical protein